jgi:hypothetical protein
MVEQSVD